MFQNYFYILEYGGVKITHYTNSIMIVNSVNLVGHEEVNNLKMYGIQSINEKLITYRKKISSISSKYACIKDEIDSLG